MPITEIVATLPARPSETGELVLIETGFQDQVKGDLIHVGAPFLIDFLQLTP